jgi:DNA replication protein DnaC
MTDAPELLLAHHLKTLRLPTFLREHDKLARICAAEGVDHVRYLARLTELELIDRERRMVERRIKSAKFPAVKSLDSFDFKAIPSLNKMMVLELARCEWIERRENVIALGPSGTGKTHVALSLGLAACQKGLSVAFVTAASLVHELMEARDEKRLMRLQRQLAKVKLLIIDELGFVPLSKTGAELLFELISQRYERGSTLITSNLPFEEWTETFGTERLTGALLDRLSPRQHPRDERRKLSSQPKPRTPRRCKPVILTKLASRPMRPGTCLPDGRPHAPRRAAMWQTFAPPLWPDFAPPLTCIGTFWQPMGSSDR